MNDTGLGVLLKLRRTARVQLAQKGEVQRSNAPEAGQRIKMNGRGSSATVDAPVENELSVEETVIVKAGCSGRMRHRFLAARKSALRSPRDQGLLSGLTVLASVSFRIGRGLTVRAAVGRGITNARDA